MKIMRVHLVHYRYSRKLVMRCVTYKSVVVKTKKPNDVRKYRFKRK